MGTRPLGNRQRYWGLLGLGAGQLKGWWPGSLDRITLAHHSWVPPLKNGRARPGAQSRPPISLASVTVTLCLALPGTPDWLYPGISDHILLCVDYTAPGPEAVSSSPPPGLLPGLLGWDARAGVGGSQEDSGYSVNTSCQYLLLPGARTSPSHLLPLQVLQENQGQVQRPPLNKTLLSQSLVSPSAK